MYEFGKCDIETQKFLICIFEVGSWYVNNVYTQLGGQLSAREVDDIAEKEASESAYNKWRNYLDIEYGKGDNIYSKSGMQTLKNAEGEEIDKEWKNYCVVDDSSKFAAAVYYHYINKEILKDEKLEDRVAYGIDLWGTNSTNYLNRNSFTNKLLETRRFKLYTWDNIMNFILKEMDFIVIIVMMINCHTQQY